MSIEDNFHDVLALGFFLRNRNGGGNDLDPIAGLHPLYEISQQGWIDHGFVALYIENDRSLFEFPHHFRDAVSSAGVFRRGDGDLCAEVKCNLSDPHVFRSNDHLIERLRLDTAFPYVLDKGFPCNPMKRLPWEPGRAPSGRDDSHNFTHLNVPG